LPTLSKNITIIQSQNQATANTKNQVTLRTHQRATTQENEISRLSQVSEEETTQQDKGLCPQLKALEKIEID